HSAALGTNLEDLGWGIIFPESAGDLPPELAALRSLLSHRQEQAMVLDPRYYHEFVGEKGYRNGESALQFLSRHGAGTLRASAERVPRYLLIVGDPVAIPFEFQYGLAIQYAVGRMHFNSLEEYERYANTVVRTERDQVRLPRKLGVFAPTFEGDYATKLASDKLITPVVAALRSAGNEWTIDAVVGAEATKVRLSDALLGANGPALIFAAGHGVSTKRRGLVGAILCAEWPGFGSVSSTMWFDASDVSPDAQLAGRIAFLMTQMSAGVPGRSDFMRSEIVGEPLLAALPKRLLGHPNGGVLAVVGHVDVLWSWSFVGLAKTSDAEIYTSILCRLMEGHTVASATELLV